MTIFQSTALAKFADAQADSKRTLRAGKPILTGKDANSLHGELKKFRLYMNEAHLTDPWDWFASARAIATDRAQSVLETMIITRFGKEDHYQAALKKKDL